MELYLDSVDQKEIEAAFRLGFLAGLTTTPTFMHRSGVTDIDGTILKLATMVPVLQIEALGQTAEEVVAEAHRLIGIGLKKETTVFKIPVSLEGVRACKMLRNEGLMVNVHLVYTLQQAYMAMAAGATYVCPLVGRLQDQGHDALELVRQCVDAVHMYGYDTKIMFSSVRHAEHVRNAINIGVHTITAPWSVMKKLTENNLTQLGTDQFFEHTRLMTIKVEEVVKGRNPLVNAESTVSEALVVMSQSGLGAATVVEANGHIKGIFTDGDLRRLVSSEGLSALDKKIGSLSFNAPLTISPDSLLIQAVELIKKHKVDNLIIADGDKPLGMLDVQDLLAMNLIS
jgi:TalC/MipB family fructose-6-phosphate aldolase